MRDDQEETPGMGAQLLRVGTVVVDLRYSRLMRDGQEILLTPRAFDLFALFLSRPGVLLSREEIFRLVWKEVLVEDANLTQTVWLLRRALGDEGKAWIRTVSKRGYVFEGPPVERVDDAVEQPAAAPVAPMPELVEPPQPHEPLHEPPVVPMPQVVAPALPRGSRERKPLFVAAVAIAVLSASFALLRPGWFASPTARVDAGRIVVIDVIGDGGSETARLAVSLTREWLVWQLGDLYLRDIVSVESGLGIGGANGADCVLLLSARTTGGSSRVLIDARLVGRGTSNRWQVEGAVDDMSRLVGDLAQQVVRDVVPDASASKALSFELSLDTARRYGAALEARKVGNGVNLRRELEDVVRREPRFDLARLQLARHLAELGRIADAREHMTALSAWIARLPPGARGLLDAQHAEIAQDFGEAVRDYAVLALAYPGQLRFRFDTTRSLLNADRAGEALLLLDDALLDPRGGIWRARWLLLRADAQLATGAPQAASVSAHRARQIALHGGSDHEGLQAQATVLAAIADAQNRGAPIDLDVLRNAAQSLYSAGDELSALYAGVVAASLETQASAVAAIDALLARARGAGNVRLEVQMLRELARLALRAGDFATYRRRLAEAYVATRIAGDRVQQRRVDADLVHDDVLRGNYATARRREAAWRGDSLLGAAALDLGIQTARLAIDVGNYGGALAQLGLLEKADSFEHRATPPGGAAARLACVRAAVQLRQGAVDDARRSYTACAEASAPADRQTAQIGLAVVALASGDNDGARWRVGALTPIADAGANTNSGGAVVRPIDIVPLLLPLGRHDEARRILDAELDYALRGGFRRLEWGARLQLASLALVERRVDEAAEGVLRARALMPGDAWTDLATARLLEAAIALFRGDEVAAWQMLAALSQEALARGDVVVQIEAQSLAGDRLDAIGSSKEARDALIVRSGLRGVSRRWLLDGVEP